MAGEVEVIEVIFIMFFDVMVGVCWIDIVEVGISMEGIVRVYEESVIGIVVFWGVELDCYIDIVEEIIWFVAICGILDERLFVCLVRELSVDFFFWWYVFYRLFIWFVMLFYNYYDIFWFGILFVVWRL